MELGEPAVMRSFNTNCSPVIKSERRLGAVLSMELVLVLPLLLTLLLGLAEFGLILQARGTVVEATRVAGRFAAQSGVNEEEINLVARRALGHRLGHAAHVDVAMGEHPGDRVAVSVAVPMGAASPDFLFWIGLSHKGGNLIAMSEFVKE